MKTLKNDIQELEQKQQLISNYESQKQCCDVGINIRVNGHEQQASILNTNTNKITLIIEIVEGRNSAVSDFSGDSYVISFSF